MTYLANNSTYPSQVAQGAVTYQNPYFRSNCGCGSGQVSHNMTVKTPTREGFNMVQPMNAHMGNAVPPHMAQVDPHMGQLVAPQAPMCTLTATAPPAGCCHPAPLHCDCCNGAGYFRASEAYGS
jgi:hypothetical protein